MVTQSVFKNINSVTFLGSSVCGMGCEYCIVGGCTSEVFKQFNSDIQRGWEDGTTVHNAVEALKRWGAPLEQIITCNFTGGEPFMSPHGVDRSIDIILSELPSIKCFYFTTNFNSVDGLINTLRRVAETAVKEMSVYLVCSIDGPDGSICQQRGHTVPWNVFKKNLQRLVSFFNEEMPKIMVERNITFHPIRLVKILLHSTISLNTYIEYFSDDKNILAYLNFIHEKSCELSDLLCYKPFSFSFSLPTISRPFFCTAEQGVKVSSILRTWDRLSYQHFFVNGTLKFADVLQPSYATFSTGGFPSVFDTYSMCDSFLYNPLILPDGTLLQCLAHIGTYLQRNRLSELVSVSSNADIDMQEKEWVIGAKYKSDLLGLNLVNGLIDELSLSGQIPFKYFGNSDAKRSAVLFMRAQSRCTSEDVKETGIFYLTYAGRLRLILNGVYDYVNASVSDQRNVFLSKFSNVLAPEAVVLKGKKWYE